MPETELQKILVVYDSSAIRGTISLIGRDKWSNLVEVDSPELAVPTIDKERPALIILCAMTGKSSIYDLCREIKGRFGQIPVMIVSLRDGEEHMTMSRKVGADRALQLSLGSDEMLMNIRSLLEVARAKARMNSGDTDVIRVPSSSRVLERLSDAERRIDELESTVRKITKKFM